jgi:glycosyltransferase involved in cell wall biosynthesis
VDAVSDMGHTACICLPYEGPLVEVLRKKGHRVYVFSLGVLRRKYFNPIGLFYIIGSFSLALFKLTRIVKSHNVKLIHSNTSTILIGGIISRLLKITHIWHVREILTSPIFLRKIIHRCLASMSDEILAVSKSTLDHILIDEPRVIDKSNVIYNGIETSKYYNGDGNSIRKDLGLNQNDLLIGMIARVNNWKGQDLFMKIAEKIINEFDNVYFLALGSPFQGMEYLLEEFREKADHLPKGKFFIHEFSENVNDYLAAYDVFILPSTQPDPFPTSVLEAMATQKAIIVNGHGGSIEMIVNENSGFVIEPPNSVGNFEAALRKFILSPGLRKDMGMHAYKKVNEQYSVEAYRNKIQEIFKKYLKCE